MQHLQGVGHRRQPGHHLLFLGAGQEADALGDFRGIAGDDHLLVDPLLDHQLQRRRHGEQGLAAARRAGQDHQVDVRIQQGIQRHALIDVLGMHPPGLAGHQPLAAEIFQADLVAVVAQHPRGKEVLLVQEVLVDVDSLQQVGIDDVDRIAAMGFAVALADPLPEAAGHHLEALGEQADVVDELVAAVILHMGKTCSLGLEAHVDVFGDQHHLTLHLVLLQVEGGVDDAVVRLLVGEHLGILGQMVIAEDGDMAARLAGQRHSLHYLLRSRITEHIFQGTDGDTGITADVLLAILDVVELFEHRHGDEHVVLFEGVDGEGFVKQNVGIQDKQLSVRVVHKHPPWH